MILRRYERGVEFDFLDLLSVDLDGGLRSVTMPRSFIQGEDFGRKIGFDGSNYGYAKVSDSDMLTIPDANTAFLEEREGFRILRMFGDVPNADGALFDQYP